MFRGTKKYEPEEFSNIIQENGGDDNAFTSDDFTDYFEVINRDHLDVPITSKPIGWRTSSPRVSIPRKPWSMEERRMRTEDNPEDALAGDSRRRRPTSSIRITGR